MAFNLEEMRIFSLATKNAPLPAQRRVMISIVSPYLAMKGIYAMLRELNLNEMEAVSGGEDVIVVTGTRTSSYDPLADLWLQDFLRNADNDLSHGGLGVFGQFSGDGGGSNGATPSEDQEASDHTHTSTCETTTTCELIDGPVSIRLWGADQTIEGVECTSTTVCTLSHD